MHYGLCKSALCMCVFDNNFTTLVHIDGFFIADNDLL